MVRAPLAALARGDIFEASQFNIWSTAHGSSFGLGIHYELMKQKLAGPPFDLLLGHAEAQLGAAALPSQRVQLQEVVVMGGSGSRSGSGGGSGSRSGSGGGGGGRAARFLWQLCMQQNSCWMVTGISLVEEF